MASTPAPPNKDEEVNNPPTSASYYQKTVCLQDWWLIKAEKDFQGRTIAVAGTTSREKFAVRMFSSAPILKTYDLHTLETVDGVSVILKGFINEERTRENGFSSEVFKHFVSGFPANWEMYAEGGFVGGSSIKHTSKMVEGSSSEDSTNSSLASDKLSTDSGTSARKESTSNSGAYGNNDEMDQGLENVAAKQTPMKSSSTTPVVAHVDDLHKAASARKESTSDSEAYGQNNEMDQDLENLADRQTPIKNMEDIHGATPDRAACTSNSGGCGNDDEMDQGLRNISARQIQTESSPANTDKIVGVDDLLEQTPNRKESSRNLGGCGNFDTMDHGLENSPTKQTLTESSPATPVVALVDGLDEATPKTNERISNVGGYGNNDEMDQGLENVATRQTPIESLPTTPLVTHTDDLHEAAQDRTECTSNLGGCGNCDEMDHSLENFAARQTQTESSPSTPIATRTKIRQLLEEVIGSSMKSPKLPSISEAGNGSNARRRSKRQKTTGSQILCIHEKIVKASSRCLNHKNTDISPKRDSEILNGEKRNGSVAAITATPVMRKDNLQEPSSSEGRMDVFSFVKSVAGGKSKVKCVTRNSPYQLRRAVYGDGKSGRRSNFTRPEVGVANTMADKTQQEHMSGNKTSQASKPSKRTRQTLKSSIGVSDISQKKKQNVADKETTAKDSGRSKKKTKRELIYESSLVQEKEVDTSSYSTESLSFKRSRSGRLLVPTLEFWRNQRVVYDGESPLVQEKEVDTSSNSTESLSFKRSRSGRLLVPTLEFWRNQRVVYDGDHKVTAFVEGLDWERTSSKVTRSEPRRKRGRL